jgi:hypothetical protein
MSPKNPLSDDPGAARRWMPHSAVLPLFIGLIVSGIAGVSQGAITLTGSTVTFAWNPSAGAEGYYLVYAPYESEPFQGPFTGKIDVGGQTRVSFEIGEGAAFHVAVQAYNAAGTSQVSNVVSFVRPLVVQEIPPVLNIRANGSASDLVVSDGTPVTISVNLDQVGGNHEIPDVWIVADTPFGFHSFRGYEGWVPGFIAMRGWFPEALPPSKYRISICPPARIPFTWRWTTMRTAGRMVPGGRPSAWRWPSQGHGGAVSGIPSPTRPISPGPWPSKCGGQGAGVRPHRPSGAAPSPQPSGCPEASMPRPR